MGAPGPGGAQAMSGAGVDESEVRHRRVPLLWGFGGGVNSWGVLAGLVQRKIIPDLITFGDTGGESDETYEALILLQRLLPSLGFPQLVNVRKDSPRVGDVTLEEECLRRETMPSRAFGLSSCAMRWKVEPQEKHLNHWPPAVATWKAGGKPIKILGYDGGEERRAGVKEDKKLRYWYPLIEWDWDRDRCIAEIEASHWPVPPKSACFYCPSSTKTEVLALAARRPDLFQRAVAIERRALTSERHTLVSIKGLGRHWSWEDLAKMSPAERANQPETPVESCTRCADDGEAA